MRGAGPGRAGHHLARGARRLRRSRCLARPGHGSLGKIAIDIMMMADRVRRGLRALREGPRRILDHAAEAQPDLVRDDLGQLFDMQADPARPRPCKRRGRRAVAAKLGRPSPPGVRRCTAPAAGGRRQAQGQGQTGRDGSAVDPRPIPVGYREFPVTMLPARDGEPRGGVQRSSAPNCSYFVNWTSPDDSMVWLLDVHTAGRYEVSHRLHLPRARCRLHDRALVHGTAASPARWRRAGTRRCTRTRTRFRARPAKAR